MNDNSIAVVITVYNKENYVARAIESVLHQTQPVDEIIIVNDASTDGSLERIQAFHDPKIRLLKRLQAGPGPSPARNVAIRAARAKWIAFLDADDEWHSNFIHEIRKLIDSAPARVGCVFTGWQDVWPDGVVNQDPFSRSAGEESFNHLAFDDFLARWLDLRCCPIWTSAVVIRRDILNSAGLFPERCYRGGDKDTWLRVLAAADARGSAKVCSSYHRITENQITRTGTTNVRHCICATLEDLISKASGQRHRLLMRLFNFEVFDYAVFASQSERISPEIYRGFHIQLNPGRYCTLLALTFLPAPMPRMMRSYAIWMRGMLKRRLSKRADG